MKQLISFKTFIALPIEEQKALQEPFLFTEEKLSRPQKKEKDSLLKELEKILRGYNWSLSFSGPEIKKQMSEKTRMGQIAKQVFSITGNNDEVDDLSSRYHKKWIAKNEEKLIEPVREQTMAEKYMTPGTMLPGTEGVRPTGSLNKSDQKLFSKKGQSYFNDPGNLYDGIDLKHILSPPARPKNYMEKHYERTQDTKSEASKENRRRIYNVK